MTVSHISRAQGNPNGEFFKIAVERSHHRSKNVQKYASGGPAPPARAGLKIDFGYRKTKFELGYCISPGLRSQLPTVIENHRLACGELAALCGLLETRVCSLKRIKREKQGSPGFTKAHQSSPRFTKVLQCSSIFAGFVNR